METQEYHVEGPVMIFLTTTAIDIDEELQNRCLTLSVDESKEQTARIHQLQRESRTLEGLRRKKQKDKVVTLLRNAQRLLEPVQVMNPWSEQLTFTHDQTRTRRDHEKYLGLIEAITLLHQHQRPLENDEIAGEYIPTTLEDIELANQLAPELLARSLDDLPPQSRRLLDLIKDMVRDRCESEALDPSTCLFSRRDVVACCGWTYSQVRRHLDRLRDLEYLQPRYGRMGCRMQYELLIDPHEEDGKNRIRLLDVAKLRGTTTTLTPSEGTLTTPCQNEMTRLSGSQEGTKKNLATLPDRTSGTRSGNRRTVAVGE
jgi:hypothetical protein